MADIIRQAKDLIPFVPNGHPIKVRIKKNRNGNRIIINDRAHFVESDLDEQQANAIKLKGEDEIVENVGYGDIYREKYWSWQYMKKKWRDYLELYEGDQGKYTTADLDEDDVEKLISAARESNDWDFWAMSELRKTYEDWFEESKIKKWLPYMVLIIVIVGQIVMMKQQGTTLQEQGDRLIQEMRNQQQIIPVLLAGTSVGNVLSRIKNRAVFWRD